MRVMDPIKERIKRFIADRDLVVLRDGRTGKALNVSYTEDGLKYTTSLGGQLLYFKNARLKVITRDNQTTFVGVEGDLEKSKSVYVEKFVPTDKKNPRDQIAEYTWTDKAYRLLLAQNEDV